MKNNSKIYLVLFTAVIVIVLVACEHASEKSGTAPDDPSQNGDSPNPDSTEADYMQMS